MTEPTEDKMLIATMGLPRSGKSTWARATGYPVVCPDEIRLALHGQRYIQEAEPFVWAIAKVMVKALFGAGHRRVVLDATNGTRERRQQWLSPEWATRFKHIDASEAECRGRAVNELDTYILPIIERQARQFEPLMFDELRFDQ